jgi:sulfur carrier protein ThiS
MKVRIKVYGTFRRQFPGYQRDRGIEVEIQDGSSVRELLERLAIPEAQGALVSMESRVLKADDLIHSGAELNILQAIGGG